MNSFQYEYNRKKKILITGGLGYVACHLALRLMMNGGYSLWLVDSANFTDLTATNPVYRERHHTLMKLSEQYKVPLKITKIDFKEISFTQLQGVVCIIHLAHKRESFIQTKEDPFAYYENSFDSIEFFKQALAARVQGFIYASVGVDGLTSNSANVTASHYEHARIVFEDFCKILLNDNNKSLYQNKYKCRVACLRFYDIIGCSRNYPCFGDFMDFHNHKFVASLFKKLEYNVDDSSIIVHATIKGDKFQTKDGTCINAFVNISDAVEAFMNTINMVTDVNKKTTIL